MVKSNVRIKDEYNDEAPSIFRAARRDDVGELRAALDDGQPLDNQDAGSYNMTPVHLACLNHSLHFLDAALTEKFNAWVRDDGGRVSMDYAVAEGLEEVADRLQKRLYPKGSDGRPIMPF